MDRATADKIESLLLSDKIDEAEDIILPMADANPDDYEVNLKLSGVYMKRGQWDKAAARLHKCITQNMESEQAWYGYAFSQWEAGNTEESIMAYRQLISVAPQHTEGLMAAGESCYKAKRFWDAYSFYKRYMDIFPFKRKEMLPRIVMCLQWAEQEQTNNMQIKVELMEALTEIGSDIQSHEMRMKAIHSNPREFCKLYPDDAVALAVKITHQIKVCQWDNYDTDVAKLRQLAGGGQACDPVFNTYGTTQEEQYENTMRFVKWKYPDLAPYKPDREIPTSGKITIGYLSSDFHEHATAFLAAGLFECHEISRFNVISYSAGPDDGSHTRKRIKDATTFRDISKLTAQEVADLIKADKVDILIDLKGWCQGHLMDVVAKRPAPILVHYLGWPGTTGVCDYILADPIVIPRSEHRWFSEEVIYLPGSYQINDERFPHYRKPPRSKYGFKDTDVIYACFNQAYKITPSVWKEWMNLLEKDDNAVLWILVMNIQQIENLEYYAGEYKDRIHEMKFVNHEEHLKRMSIVEFSLDTQPVCGHTTSSDCLRMGIPILKPAQKGVSFISRVTESLEENKDTLFDTKAKTKQIENAYLEMVEKHNEIYHNGTDITNAA